MISAAQQAVNTTLNKIIPPLINLSSATSAPIWSQFSVSLTNSQIRSQINAVSVSITHEKLAVSCKLIQYDPQKLAVSQLIVQTAFF